MEELQAFSVASPAVLLWKGLGAYQKLYRFLAPRFLANPDSVLDCERQHAVWQWHLSRRRSLKLKALNAYLKISDWLRVYNALPPIGELLPHLQAIRKGERMLLESIRARNEIAPGLRRDSIYWDRLNLSLEDVALVKGILAPGGVDHSPNAVFHVQWANHVRWTFTRTSFFSFPTLSPRRYVYVIENKTLAGREDRLEGDAVGRTLVVAWFEELSETDNGVIVRRCDRTSEQLVPQLCTIAELLHAAGLAWPLLGPDISARAAELAMEEQYESVTRLHWQSSFAPDGTDEDPWVFSLTDAEPAERRYYNITPGQSLSNLQLARLLQMDKGRDMRWAYRTLTKAHLWAALTAL